MSGGSFTKRCEQLVAIIKINTNLPKEIAVICAEYTSQAERADFYMLQELDIHIRKNLNICSEVQGKNKNQGKEAKLKKNQLWNLSTQLFTCTSELLLEGEINLSYGEKLEKYKKCIKEAYIWLPFFVIPKNCNCHNNFVFLFR